MCPIKCRNIFRRSYVIVFLLFYFLCDCEYCVCFGGGHCCCPKLSSRRLYRPVHIRVQHARSRHRSAPDATLPTRPVSNTRNARVHTKAGRFAATTCCHTRSIYFFLLRRPKLAILFCVQRDDACLLAHSPFRDCNFRAVKNAGLSTFRRALRVSPGGL